MINRKQLEVNYLTQVNDTYRNRFDRQTNVIFA